MCKFTARTLSILCALAMLLALFAGCAGNNEEGSAPANESSLPVQSRPDETPDGETDPVSDGPKTTVRVGTLKGPSGIGMVRLMDQSDRDASVNRYKFTLESAPDVIQGKIVNGELDIAALPTNVTAALYAKTGQDVNLIAITTLGVLYVVQRPGAGVESIADLAGKTVVTAGQGSTQEYVLNYLIEKNGLTDVSIDYKSEHAEVASLLLAGECDVALLPQPFVTSVQIQDETLAVALDITEEWAAVSGGTQLVMTGILVRRAFLEENPQAVEDFLAEYRESVEFVNANVEEAAALVGGYEIIAEAVAKLAIPACNIVFISGEEMRRSAEAYLTAIAEQNPAAVGGSLPDEGFYYIPA